MESMLNIVIKNREMIKIVNVLKQVAPTDVSILIQGESGTGKEIVSYLAHKLSTRSNMPFLPINCAAIPDNLVEAELFGYRAGAFTGANKPKPGKFELANSGTLVLDEIGDLPFSVQAKLLRVLEEKYVDQIGGIKRISIDVRIIACTNKDLNLLIREGNFREDLYYRLAEVTIHIPPLLELPETIALTNSSINDNTSLNII